MKIRRGVPKDFEYLVRRQFVAELKDIADIPYSEKDWIESDCKQILKCSELMKKYAALTH